MSGRSEENRCRCPHGSALIASHIDRSREPRMGSVADKIAKKITMQIRSNVIDLSSYRAGRELAHEAGLDNDRVRKLVQQGSDPCHALYVVGQNFASVLAEQISMMSEAKGYARVVGRAEDEYLPSGPPMSPLTPSYFTTWAFFDVQFGASRETMGTTILRVAELTGLPKWILDVVGLMHQSRMGFYVNCGIEGSMVMLREITTQAMYRCHVPAGYVGRPGELWFVRLMPPVNALVDYHIVFTTPYVLVNVAEQAMIDYIGRELARMEGRRLPRVQDLYANLMKHGTDANHWNEYIFCAYCGHQHDAIFLTGIPDIKPSLPHA